MRVRTIAPALLLCLALTACGVEEQEKNETSLLGQAAGIDDAAVLLTVDGREIPAWHYLYWLDFTCTRLRERYQEAEIPLDWGASADDGKGTLADYAKAQALADTALYATVEAWAETYGCAFTSGDEEEAADIWAKQCAAHGGEEAYLAFLAEQGLDRARMDSLTRTGLLYRKLFDLFRTEESPAHATSAPGLTVDRIFVAAGGDREAAREKAAELFSRLNSAEDQAAAFDALAAEGDEPTGPWVLFCGDLPESLEEAAAALEEGQFSGILEAEDGFSILRRLPEESAPLDGNSFDQLLEEAAGKAEIQTTEAYGAIDPAAFFETLESARETAG